MPFTPEKPKAGFVPEATPTVPVPSTGRLEAGARGLEAAMDPSGAVNRAFAAPFTTEGRRGIAEGLRRIGQRIRRNVREVVPGLEFTAEDEAARRADLARMAQEDEANRDAAMAAQYRAWREHPEWFTAGAMLGIGGTLSPEGTVALGQQAVRGAAQSAPAQRLRDLALLRAQRAESKLLRNPSGVGAMAAESVGTTRKADVLQSALNNPAMTPHGAPSYPQQVVEAARETTARVGAQMDVAATRAGQRGVMVDMGAVLQDFRASMPGIVSKNPGAETALRNAEKFLAKSAARRGGRYVSPKDAWDIRKQIDFEAFGLRGESDVERNLRSALQYDMRNALTGRLNTSMQQAGETGWLQMNKDYSTAKTLEDIALGGVKNVETGAATPAKPPFKLRLLGTDIQPVAYMTGTAPASQKATAFKARTLNRLAKGIERAAAGPYRVPEVPPELGPNPYTFGPDVPPGRSLAVPPQSPPRGGQPVSPPQGPIPAGPSPYAYPGPASTGLPPASTGPQLPPSSVLPRKALPPARPSLRRSVLAERARRAEPGGLLAEGAEPVELAGAKWSPRRKPGFGQWRPETRPTDAAEADAMIERARAAGRLAPVEATGPRGNYTTPASEFTVLQPKGPVPEPPPALSNAEKADLRRRAEALRASKSVPPQVPSPPQRRKGATWNARVRAKLLRELEPGAQTYLEFGKKE